MPQVLLESKNRGILLSFRDEAASEAIMDDWFLSIRINWSSILMDT